MTKDNTMTSHLEKLRSSLLNLGILSDYLIIAEEKSKIPIEQLCAFSMVVLLICVHFGILSNTITSLIGFVYPLFATIEELEEDKREKKKTNNNIKINTTGWLTYWMMFSSISFLEGLIGSFTLVYWIPFFYTMKLTFFLACQLPNLKVLETCTSKIFLPFAKMNEDVIDKFLNAADENNYKKTS